MLWLTCRVVTNCDSCRSDAQRQRLRARLLLLPTKLLPATQPRSHERHRRCARSAQPGPFSLGLHYFDLLRICSTTSCTTNPQRLESQRQVHNRSPQQVVRQAASLTTSWTTCRTASPQQVHSKLHATISKSYSKSHNLLYNKFTANRSNGVRHLGDTYVISDTTIAKLKANLRL